MTTFELTPTNGRKSFYGKCRVEVEDNIESLRSYNTVVATYNRDADRLTINGYYSATTKRHLDAFLVYLGKPQMSKAEILKSAK